MTYPRGVVVAAGLIGFAENELVAFYRIRVSRRIGSAALVAGGLHARTDGFTSLAILIVLRGQGRDICRGLMDAVDPTLTIQAPEVVVATVGVLELEYLRLRWIGHRISAEAGIVVNTHTSVGAAHEIAHDVERRLFHDIPQLARVTIHVSSFTSHVRAVSTLNATDQ